MAIQYGLQVAVMVGVSFGVGWSWGEKRLSSCVNTDESRPIQTQCSWNLVRQKLLDFFPLNLEKVQVSKSNLEKGEGDLLVTGMCHVQVSQMKMPDTRGLWDHWARKSMIPFRIHFTYRGRHAEDRQPQWLGKAWGESRIYGPLFEQTCISWGYFTQDGILG